MIKKIMLLWAALFLLVSNASSDVITLHIPIIDDSPKQHAFYHELLETALKEDGHTPKLITPTLPQLRIKSYLDKGKISIYWMVESDERNKHYLPVEVGLTNKLIGKRILFIKKGDQYLYDGVNNLDDFRNLKLVGGMGKKWFDIDVWKENNLLYLEHSGNWKVIFRMVALGVKYNYFSRGLNEIAEEAKQYPDLAIEKRLVLIYDRDFRFYLSKTGVNAGVQYRGLIAHALKKAGESGLVERLVREYWDETLKTLNYDKRIKIYLKTPE